MLRGSVFYEQRTGKPVIAGQGERMERNKGHTFILYFSPLQYLVTFILIPMRVGLIPVASCGKVREGVRSDSD